MWQRVAYYYIDKQNKTSPQQIRIIRMIINKYIIIIIIIMMIIIYLHEANNALIKLLNIIVPYNISNYHNYYE
jgi:hypothetical protein